MKPIYPATRTTPADYGSPTPDQVNAAMRVIEERADEELRKNALIFTDWCTGEDMDKFSALLSAACDPDPYRLSMLRDQLHSDYTQWRVELAQDTDEWNAILTELADASGCQDMEETC